MTRLFLFLILLFPCAEVLAQEPSVAFRSTEYPLPRFVSLRSSEVYVRTGPGQKYPVQWVFQKQGLPVEIILEYDVWRKIQDFEGEKGWVHKSLLSGRRTGVIRSEEMTAIRRKPNKNSSVNAYLKPNVLVHIEQCEASWCFVEASGYKGWLEKNMVWGVYEDEEFD